MVPVRPAAPTRRTVLCAVLAVAIATVGCSATHHSARKAKTTRPPASSSSVVASRWWSNSAVAVGSTISSAHPDAAAAQLHPSKDDYCGMLKQTVDAGKSILPAGVTDPALLISSKAFVAEIEKVAPLTITAQWQVLGPAILVLVKSGGNTAALKPTDLGTALSAATAIADDSLKNCGVDLSSVTGLLPSGS